MIKTAKDDIDHQLIVKELGKTKYPKSLPQNHPGRELNSVWSQLSVNKLGLIILDGNRIFVPKGQRKELLELIHTAHCGTDKTKRRANELYFWRGMASDVHLLVHKCEICRPFLPFKVGNS